MPENSIPSIPLFIDSSMISTFRSCPRKFFWQYMHNLRARGSSIHLAAGAAFAAALDAIRTYQALHPESPVDANLLFDVGIGPALLAWGDQPDDPDSPKNLHNVLCAIELYLQEFHPYYDEIQPLVVNEKPTTEFSFAIPLDIKHPSGDPYIYVGRFDMLGKYRSNDLLVVLDDKTTSSLGSYWLKQWDLRGQFIGYVWACHKMGYEVNNVVVRGTGLLKTETNFLSLPLSYPLHLIQRWEQELYNSLELINFFHSRSHFPYNFGEACASYGSCPMIDLCKAQEPEQWFNNYDIEVWNPVLQD